MRACARALLTRFADGFAQEVAERRARLQAADERRMREAEAMRQRKLALQAEHDAAAKRTAQAEDADARSRRAEVRPAGAQRRGAPFLFFL